MERIKTLCCSYPTSILMVDDSDAFLCNFSLRLLNDFCCITETNPVAAIRTLLASYQPFFEVDALSNSRPGRLLSNVNDPDFSVLEKISNAPEKSETISVVIVDYSMPEMNGLEFCEQISDLPVKKIMLTGEADLETAIEAFNVGLIDKFFLKNDVNVHNKIRVAAAELQREYFESLSLKIIDKVSPKILGILQDQRYADLHESVLEKNCPEEYYLASASGSFLLVRKDGTKAWLAVNQESDIEYYFDVALGNEAPHKIVEDLRTKSKLLFSPTGEHIRKPVDTWSNYMYDITAVEAGVSRYFYTTVPG